MAGILLSETENGNGNENVNRVVVRIDDAGTIQRKYRPDLEQTLECAGGCVPMGDGDAAMRQDVEPWHRPVCAAMRLGAEPGGGRYHASRLRGIGVVDSLAYEQHIDGAEIKVIVEGEGSEAVVGGVLSGVELQSRGQQREGRGPGVGIAWRAEEAHHDRLALVLYNVARAADFVAAAEAEEHELVGGVDGLLGRGRVHGRGLAFRGHVGRPSGALALVVRTRSGEGARKTRRWERRGGEDEARREAREARREKRMSECCLLSRPRQRSGGGGCMIQRSAVLVLRGLARRELSREAQVGIGVASSRKCGYAEFAMASNCNLLAKLLG